MRTPFAYVPYVAALGLALTACGSDKKKDDAAPAPIEIDTFGESEADGTNARVQYRSNVKDAKFKCMVEVDGQAGQWQDCPDGALQLQLSPGVRYTVKVKAVSPNGAEDKEPYSRTFVGAGAATGDGPEMETVILGKEGIGATFSRSSLRVGFSVRGQDVDVDDVRFECKRDGEADFRRCPESESYEFKDLIDNSDYELSVRAVHRDSGAIAKPDTVKFKVQLAQLQVEGAEQLATAKSGQFQLRVDAAQAPGGLECVMDQQPAVTCPNPIPVDMGQLQSGSHSLTIRAKDAQGGVAAQRTINFCVGVCSAQGGANAQVGPVVTHFQIGSFYEFQIPADTHVTQYATTKTYNNALSFYRVMAESDPYYIGNYGCFAPYDRRILAQSPGGGVYEYCHSTPQRDVYKWMTDFRLANNHIEVATDAAKVTPYNHERIHINVFDTDYEFMHDRSRFEQLCMNRRGTIQKSPPIRFIDRDFWGESVKAEFYMCTPHLVENGGLPGLPAGRSDWWVGAFFITTTQHDLPRWECFEPNIDYQVGYHGHGHYERVAPSWCGTYKNPALLEVVFMTKTPWIRAEDFARHAQNRFRANLQEITPIR